MVREASTLKFDDYRIHSRDKSRYYFFSASVQAFCYIYAF